jgi:hypothetical protein
MTEVYVGNIIEVTLVATYTNCESNDLAVFDSYISVVKEVNACSVVGRDGVAEVVPI